MENILIDILKKSLDSLDKYTIWIFATLIAISLSLLQREDKFKVGTLEIEKRSGGILLYLLLCSLNYLVLKQLQNIEHIYNQLKTSKKLLLTLQLHPWIFNPFSKTSGVIGNITDHIGYPFLIIIWWIGFALAQRLIQYSDNKIKLISVIFFVIYLLLGLLSLMIVLNLIGQIEPNSPKIIIQYFGIGIGLLLFTIIMKRGKNE